MKSGTKEKAVSIKGSGCFFSPGRTLLMGVLNITSDSFSDGGFFMDPNSAVKRAVEIEALGADIIDIGGESSRPGALPLSEEEEISRIIPVLKRLKGKVGIPISVDTYKSAVAEAALGEGAQIINDITALRGDKRMARVIAKKNASVVLMHMKGSPANMQQNPVYKDVIREISGFLSASIDLAVEGGISGDKIAVDPGIGFGKTVEHNLIILKFLRELKKLNKPVLIGVSRKSFLGQITGRKVDERVICTAAAVAASIFAGASVVRVHDIEEMRDVVSVCDAINNAGGK